MFAREGYPTMALATIVAVIIGFITWYSVPSWLFYVINAPVVVCWGIVIYFFRDPERDTPEGTKKVISPADGKIVLIKETHEDIYLKEKAIQISIFLSPLNVHVNRNPISGLLEYVKYHPGKYLMAWDENASVENERADFGVLHSSGVKLFFRQITGFLARRIVYHISEGDQLKAGERFGMMKFGSRMDILIPAGKFELQVKEGDQTVAGESVLGLIR